MLKHILSDQQVPTEDGYSKCHQAAASDLCGRHHWTWCKHLSAGTLLRMRCSDLWSFLNSSSVQYLVQTRPVIRVWALVAEQDVAGPEKIGFLMASSGALYVYWDGLSKNWKSWRAILAYDYNQDGSSSNFHSAQFHNGHCKGLQNYQCNKEATQQKQLSYGRQTSLQLMVQYNAHSSINQRRSSQVIISSQLPTCWE